MNINKEITIQQLRGLIHRNEYLRTKSVDEIEYTHFTGIIDGIGEVIKVIEMQKDIADED